MVGVHRRRDTWVSTAGNNNNYNDNDGEEIPKSYCSRCGSFGFYYLLGPHKYSKEQLINGQKPRDSDSWLQCPNCGDIVGLVHAKQENEIVGVKDVPDSIYDPKKLYVEHFIKPRKRMKKVNSSSRINPEEDDPDLKSFLENGRQLTNYYSSAD